MTYTPQTWVNDDPTTPLSAARLNYIEAGIAAASTTASPTFTGTVTAPEYSASGLTGATGASRYVGATASGAPVSGTFAIGDFVIDRTGAIWICTAAGTPGTWGSVTVSAGTVGGPAKIVRRTGNSSTIASTTILASDDTLLFAVGTADVWWIEAFLIFTAADNGGAAATADIKLGWSVPTSGVMQWGAQAAPATGTTTWNGVATSATPIVLKSAANSQSFGSAALTLGITLVGNYVGGGTSGNVALQWAQNTSDISTLLIAANSFLRLTRLA